MAEQQLVRPNLGVTGTAGMCLSMQEDVWSTTHMYDYAQQAWDSSAPFNHPGEQPPEDAAVLVFWRYYDQKAGVWYGHIATWVPGRGVFSSPFNTSTGAEWYASVDAMTARINKITNAQASYLGWSEKLANVRVAQPQGENMSQVDLGIARILAFYIGGLDGEDGRANALTGAADADLQASHVGKETNTDIENWYNAPSSVNYREKVLPQVFAARDAAQAQVKSLTDQLAEANAKLAAAQSTTAAQPAVKILSDLQAALGELQKYSA